MKKLLLTPFFKIMLIVTVIFISGCASSGREMATADLQKIEIGTTTKEEMLAMFGQPISLSYGANGNLSMLWHYVHVGFMGSIESQNLAVAFDDKEIVLKYTAGDTRQDKG